MVVSSRIRILQTLARRKGASGTTLAERLGVSRQAINRQLRILIREGLVIKQGVTQGSTYSLARRGTAGPEERVARRTLDLRAIAEDRVFGSLAEELQLHAMLCDRALAIMRYAFTEMLNNAIDHSRARRGAVEMSLGAYDCAFTVRDFGIGVFNSIQSKLHLDDEATAMAELLKGKTTTMPEKHSGEGLFFTSRAADRLRIRSHRIQVTFDNRIKDTHVEEGRFLKGTDVRFAISRRSRRDLASLFHTYSPEEYGYEFQRTRILVHLHLSDYVSRSEAKRLMIGLEKFKEIILDLRKVKSIGQGFADEVFRVFPREHAGIAVRPENMSPVVEQMIRHVMGNRSNRQPAVRT